MPRKPRSQSSSEFMHVVVRGIGKQLIFEEVADYRYYLKKLEEYCLETNVKICAYCLMENHVHLLTKGETAALTLLMKKVGVSYSYYFNQKYERSGHLFQDRYLSEPVDNWSYYLTVYRYILQNPAKAGICKPSKYRWSSYGYYDNWPEFLDFELIKNTFDTRSKYAQFMEEDNEDQCLEYDAAKHDDEWALNRIKECLGINNGLELQKYGRNARDAALKKMIEEGITKRQIERLTGISRRTIKRAVGNDVLAKCDAVDSSCCPSRDGSQ